MYAYHVKGDEVAGKDQRFFHLRLTWDGDETDQAGVDKFAVCLRTIRRAVGQVDGQVEVLWDDISSSYSRKAYPLIHETENLMRKLIATFMLTTVGQEWVNEAAPKEVKDAIKSKRKPKSKATDETLDKPQDYVNVLHTVDFCHLGDILFDRYSTRSVDGLYDAVSRVNTPSDLKLAELQDYIPRSNWHRYFSSLVSCPDDYLRSRWEDLYDLRCQVAHNATFTKADFEKLKRLVSEVKPKLLEAIKKLPSVSVPEREMEALAESAARRINESLGSFINEWKQFEDLLIRKAAEKGKTHMHGYKAIEAIRGLGLLDEAALQSLEDVRRFRNRVVHGPRGNVTPGMIAAYTQAVQTLIRSLEGGPGKATS